jgi:hypothetical protein
MSHIKNTLTIALAGLAVASLPVLVDAQSTPTPQTPTSRASQPNRSGADKNSPQHHLDEARRVLTSITSNSVQGETRSKVNELKRHFTQLETTFRASSASSAQMGASRSTEPPTSAGTATGSTTSGTGTEGTAGTSGTATSGTTEQAGRSARGQRSGSGSGDWMTHYTAIDSLLDELIGSGASADASMSGTTGSASGSGTASTTGSTSGSTAGTSGSPTEQRGTTARSGASASGGAQIDASVRTKLVEFKRHLDQFHSAAMNQSGRGEEDMASADPSSGVTGSMTRPDPSSSTGSSTTATGTTATGTTGSATTGTTGSATGSTATTAHPTTTSPETPQATGTSGTASTMSGTAGTSGSATTQSTQTSAQASVDSAAIARLTASIDEMLRGSASTSTTAGTTSTTGSPTASGTVGTSGTTSSSTGTVCVDRAKLEELKTQIQALQNRPR